MTEPSVESSASQALAMRLRRRWKRWLMPWCSRRWFRKAASCGRDVVVVGPLDLQIEGHLEVGNNCCFHSRPHNRVEMTVRRNGRLILGNRVFLNKGVRLGALTEIRIGNDVQIGDECVLLDADYHGVGDESAKSAPIIIEPEVWLATRVIVLKGVTIGRGSVVGAGSVVTKSIPPYSFAAGVPARVLRSLDPVATKDGND